MPKNKPSGCANRKRKALKEAALQCHSLDGFFKSDQLKKPPEESDEGRLSEESKEVSDLREENRHQDQPASQLGEGPSSEVVESNPASAEEAAIQMNDDGDDDDDDDDSNFELVQEQIAIDLNVDYPSDPALYRDHAITPKLIRELLKIGPCQPGLKDEFDDFTGNKDQRRFRKEWYVNSSVGKCKVNRNWLIFSPRLNKCFCFSCWLFADKNNKNYTSVWADPNVGFSNFKKGTEKIADHEQTAIHRTANETLLLTNYRLAQEQTVITQLLTEEEEAIKKNRNILKRLLDCVSFLSKQGLAFRGHREYAGGGVPGSNEGNYLELLKLLAKYDTLLDEHLKYSKNSEMYLSHDIQNDLIEAIAQELSGQILEEVRAAKFFTLIIDSTIDISHVDQFSLSLRYVTSSGHSQESFIAFKELEDGSAAGYFEMLRDTFKSLNLDLKYCRGQAYDGASTMSGIENGLQQRVKDVSPSAIYIHCCAHNLNLVLIDAASSCVSAQLFFGTLESLYVFITSSLPRLKIFQEEQLQEKQSLEEIILTLKRLSDTRWASRKSAIDAVCSNIKAIESALARIRDGDVRNCTHQVVAEANGLLQTLDTFEFKVMLCFWQKVLTEIRILSSYLQSNSIDLNTAATFVKTCSENIQALRTDEMFDQIENNASKMAQACNSSVHYKVQRTRRIKRQFDEMAADTTSNDSRCNFKTNTFFYILDMFSTKLSTRFADFNEVVCKFEVLDPRKFVRTDDTDIENLRRLAAFYAEDIDINEVVDEFVSFKRVYHNIFTSSKVKEEPLATKDILSFIIANDMYSTFPNLSILYSIFLTLPVSSAFAERTFSRLKLIKNYLRSTMDQNRLSNLALISMERNRADQLDLEKVIDRFSKSKVRKMKLR